MTSEVIPPRLLRSLRLAAGQVQPILESRRMLVEFETLRGIAMSLESIGEMLPRGVVRDAVRGAVTCSEFGGVWAKNVGWQFFVRSVARIDDRGRVAPLPSHELPVPFQPEYT